MKWLYLLAGGVYFITTSPGRFTAPTNVGEYRVTVNTNHRVDTVRVIVREPVIDSTQPLPLPTVTGPGWFTHYSFDTGQTGTTPPGFFGGTFPLSGTFLTTEKFVAGGQAARVSIQEGTDGWGSFGGVLQFPQDVRRGETIRVRAHFWMPTSFIPNQRNGDRLKFLRIIVRTATDGHVGALDLHFNWNALTATNPYSWSFEGAWYPNYWRDFGSGHPIVQQQWESFEWAVTLDNVPVTEGGMARVLIWKNGALVADIKDARTLREPTDVAKRFMLFTFWNGLAQQNFHMFVDELTITTQTPTLIDTQGNVFLGPLIR